MGPFCLVSILEDALFRRQPKGWTPNWVREGFLTMQPSNDKLCTH
jgi:hypothetical protein